MADCRESISNYIDTICAYNYQIYPLLDSIEGGESQIQAFRKSISELMKHHAKLSSSYEAMLQEVIDLADFCAEHPFETVNQDVLTTKAMSILADPDYRVWVDSFIDSGKEDLYWQCLAENSFSEHPDLLPTVMKRLIGSMYEAPTKMKAQVIYLSFSAMQDARGACKEFLVNLSAINYWLIRKGGQGETLSDVMARYRSQNVFAVEREIR